MTAEETAAALANCCGKLCKMCEPPDDYAYRRRSVDLANLLTRAVENDLTALEREAVTLFWFEGMTLTEIAQRTGRAPPNISRSLDRAKEKLHLFLKAAVQYQHDLEDDSLTPLALQKAMMVAAAAKQKPGSTGGRIKKERLARNIDLPALAPALNMTQRRLKAAEEDKIRLYADELLDIANFFDLKVDYLLKGEAEPLAKKDNSAGKDL
ncbi:MAG: helix-turn-helix domain-containing protein [Clostridiales bacterium]|nr:helix-turn-helix domain-containing protein [Clostridiales bacterium]